MFPNSTTVQVGAFLSAAAIANKHDALAAVKELRADVESVNVMNNLGETALHCAKHANVIRWLVGEGANLNAQDKEGMTPLHKAASRGQGGVMYALLDSGASTDIRNNAGATPLSYTWTYGWEQPKLILIAFGAETKDAPASLRRISPLMAAAQANLPTQFARLLGEGAPKRGPSSPQRLLEYAQGQFGRDAICAILQAHMAKETMRAIASRARAAP